MANGNADVPIEVTPVDPPVQFAQPQLDLALREVDNLVRASEARQAFGVDGTGLAVAVCDTGLRTTHVDFLGRVKAQRNFTSDNGGDPNNAADGNGHGTNVGGIIVADGDHLGMAPGASIIPIKVLGNNGSGSFAAVNDALGWVRDNRELHGISVVCMSLGDSGNHGDDGPFAAQSLVRRIEELRQQGVAVCIASGNDYFTHGSQQGMGFPGILRHAVSVGAVFDDFVGGFRYSSGAEAFSSGPDRITPFSQRLHESVNEACRTDIFAPGAPVTSAGIQNDHGESVQQGTSQATPVVAGIILLMQQLHRRQTGKLPTVDELVEWLRRGAVTIHDGDDEDDNVTHTNLDFPRLDAFGALDAVRRDLVKSLLEGQPLRAAG